MNSIVVSSVVFASIFAASLVGMALRRLLPERQLDSDAKDVVRLVTGVAATMAALVLGMLVSSAKSFYDARQSDVEEMSSKILTIDRLLERYGPETGDIRAQFRQLVEAGVERVWPTHASVHIVLRPKEDGKGLINQMESLVPKNEVQTTIKAQIFPLVVDFQQTQWLSFLRTHRTAILRPLLLVVVSWLAVVFVGFGLFAPPNPTVIATLALGALTVSGAILMIMEMYSPFGGILSISSGPIIEALSQMRR